MTTTTTRIDIGLATYRAIAALFASYRDGQTDPGEDGAIARAAVRFLDALTPGRWKARGTVTLSRAEATLLVEEFTHLAHTPALLPEFEGTRRNDLVRYAFANLATTIGGAR